MRTWIPTFVFFVVIGLAGALLKLTIDLGRQEMASETQPARLASSPQEPTPQPKPTRSLAVPRTRPAPPASGNPFVHSLAGSAPHWSRDEDAADHVAGEILDTLADQPVLVVWLFDRTESAGEQRVRVVARMERIYQIFDDLARNKHPAFAEGPIAPLVTVVGSFAQNVEFHTPEPTVERDQIGSALAAIREDGGTEEHTFAAIGEAVHKYRQAAAAQHRRMIVVVTSDEVGDDAQQVDELVGLLRKYAVTLYVIGVPAPFGRSGSLSPVPLLERFKPVRQGPESLESEVIDLGTGSGPQTPLDSGFGPFALSRLALESGGVYMAVRHVTLFDPATLARYAPDYVSRRAYQALLDDNPARRALVETARLPHVNASAYLQLEFPKKDEASLKRSLDKAQQTAARLEPKLRDFYPLLAAGERDRARLEGLRWQAGYDLAMGQVTAARARIEGYNANLALLKQGRNFSQPGHSVWVLKPSNNVRNDSSLEKLSAQAQKYLERVVREHPETPWAMIAARELASPLGWEWASR